MRNFSALSVLFLGFLGTLIVAGCEQPCPTEVPKDRDGDGSPGEIHHSRQTDSKQEGGDLSDDVDFTCEVYKIEEGPDCDDRNPDVNPATVEICDNGIDDNCNKAIDEEPCYVLGDSEEPADTSEPEDTGIDTGLPSSGFGWGW